MFASEIALLHADLGLFFPATAGSATAVQTRLDPRETLAYLRTVYEEHCSIRTTVIRLIAIKMILQRNFYLLTSAYLLQGELSLEDLGCFLVRGPWR